MFFSVYSLKYNMALEGSCLANNQSGSGGL